jgi:hypothetical protein
MRGTRARHNLRLAIPAGEINNLAAAGVAGAHENDTFEAVTVWGRKK